MQQPSFIVRLYPRRRVVGAGPGFHVVACLGGGRTRDGAIVPMESLKRCGRGDGRTLKGATGSALLTLGRELTRQRAARKGRGATVEAVCEEGGPASGTEAQRAEFRRVFCRR